MKKTLAFLLLFLLGPMAGRTQDYGEALAPLTRMSRQAAAAREANRYADEVRAWEDVIACFRALPDSVQTALDDWNGGSYLCGIRYNLACACSLAGKRREALRNLSRAIDEGYLRRSYDTPAWMLQDPDLENIRGEKGYEPLRQKAREAGDFLWMLRQSGAYDRQAPTDSLPPFRYAAPDDRNLVRVRAHFNLDSIAGAGDELSKIRNLLHWAHNVVPHDGSSCNPEKCNAIDLVEVCRREGRGINCRMMAQLLNECYLAMGFKSRFVTCMPRKMVDDCHVICTVYSATLGKWVWVDPTFNAYVTDEHGTMLSIAEVRERMRDGRPYLLNREANWNNRESQTKERYLDLYMAKNLYYVVCSDRSEFDTETRREGKRPLRYIALLPEGYRNDQGYRTTTTNDAWFWQSPYAADGQ